MPELPEVQTVLNQVAPEVIGLRIQSARSGFPRTIGASLATWRRRLVGARIASARRRGKYMVFSLGRAGTPAGDLLCHLRMSGRLHVDPARAPERRWTRARVTLSGGRELRFVDVRRFGRLVWVEDAAAALAHLGPEPLEPAFTRAWLGEALAQRRRQIKPLLLDQAFLAGLGNIYVDESLHRAGVHPARPANELAPAEIRRLHATIRRVLRAAIEREGSSFDGFYVTPEGSPGDYQHLFRVYGRGGKPCPKCRTEIVRIVLAQRGTHYCPTCQP